MMQECRPCDELCSGCYGSTSHECINCTGYKDPIEEELDDCVEACQSGKYADELSRQCMDCDGQCLECQGPSAAECTSCRDLKLYYDLEDRDHDSPVSKQLSLCASTWINMNPGLSRATVGPGKHSCGTLSGKKFLSSYLAHSAVLYIFERHWGPLNVVGPGVTYPLLHTLQSEYAELTLVMIVYCWLCFCGCIIIRWGMFTCVWWHVTLWFHMAGDAP